MRKIRTAVLISGRGSNMAALAKAAQDPDYPAEIALVISNVPDTPGLRKAKELGVTAISIDHKAFLSRRQFETALDTALREADIDLVCCAGFMRVLTPWFVTRWENRLLNIHPSLLPKYKGLNTHQRALDAGDTEAGVTVHQVTAALDDGLILGQARVPVLADDTAQTLAARVLIEEHKLYPAVLRDFVKTQ